MNALTEEDIKTIWLPLIGYDNSDQKEVTRLGEYGNGEWATIVTVTRNLSKTFSRSGWSMVDEAEIFAAARQSVSERMARLGLSGGGDWLPGRA